MIFSHLRGSSRTEFFGYTSTLHFMFLSFLFQSIGFKDKNLIETNPYEMEILSGQIELRDKRV